MQEFSGKAALVTGAASGVGRALAELLSAEGARVVLSDIEAPALERAVAAIKDQGGDAIGIVADVANQESLEALAEKAWAHYGEIHLVFANAGVGTRETGMMWEYSLNDWKWGFNVNTWGVIHSIRAFMPRLVAQGGEAHFAITGSGNGALLMLPNTPVYTATKAAVQAITENLHFQVQAAQLPVKIHALFPGPHVVETGLFNSERNRHKDVAADPDRPDSGIHSVDDMRKMMAEYGMKLETTSPQEVAAMALQGIREDRFWILEQTERSRDALRQRLDWILAKQNPTPPNVL